MSLPGPRQRWAVVIASLILVLASASATAGAFPSRGPSVTLTLTRFFGDCAAKYKGVTDPAKGVDECSEIQILTNRWNARHPETQIRTDVIDPTTYFKQISARLASSDPPDIALMRGSMIPEFASRGVLTPLDVKLVQADIRTRDFLPTAINYASYRGRMYALPFDIHTLLWFINVDLFRKAGLVDSQGKLKLPHTLSQFLADAATIQKRTGKQFIQAQTIDADVGTDWSFDSFVWQQGGELFTRGLGRAAVNSGRAMRAVQFWRSLIRQRYTSATVKDTNAMFLHGNVASLINGTWAVNQFGSEVKSGRAAFKHLAVLPFPTVFGKPAAWSNSHLWVLPAQPAADPMKTQAAMQFLRYLYDNDLQWARTGHLSVRKSVLASKPYQSLPYRRAYAAAARNARAVPRLLQIDRFEAVMQAHLRSIYLAKQSPLGALDDAERLVNRLLQ